MLIRGRVNEIISISSHLFSKQDKLLFIVSSSSLEGKNVSGMFSLADQKICEKVLE